MHNRNIFLVLLTITSVKQILSQEIQFSGYLGGSDFEHIRDLTTDRDGNIYVTGGTVSPDFPVTAGAYQTIHNPGPADDPAIDLFDVFVTKLDPEGNIIWSTFIGGPNYDRAYGIEVDSLGYVYIAGRAGRGFPVTVDAFQTAFQGGQAASFYGPQDGFVAKLKPDGSGLVWASYFGTSDVRIIRDLAVDKNGEVYIASAYSSGAYPPNIADKFTNTPKGNQDAVIAKISSDGAAVIWATYLGGTGWESNENSVKISLGDPYFLYTTESSGIATSGAYDTTYGGSQDFLISRISATTGSVTWASYLGGSGNESTETHEFAVDKNGNAYVSGPTKSSDYPVTAGAFQSTFIGPAGYNDIVVSKLSPDGVQLLGSTYIGGNSSDRTEGIDVDDQERVFITGTTASTNFPLTANAFQMSLADTRDAFAVVMAADFKTLDYSTYIGSVGGDYGRCADVDVFGNFVLGGEAADTGWPLIGPGRSYVGGGDAMIAKFSSGLNTHLANYDSTPSFKIYPNPGENEIFMDLFDLQHRVSIKISNTLGQVRWRQNYEEISEIYMDMNSLSPGLYVITIQTGNRKTQQLMWVKR